MQTGQKLQKLRLQANLTQEQLAEKLYVSRDLVSKWETGVRRPDHKTVLRICEILSVSPDELIQADDNILHELSECIPENLKTKDADVQSLLNPFLRTLPERDCNIFIMRYYRSDDMQRIAEKTGLREANVRLILHRTRKKFRKYLSEETIHEQS